MKDVNQLKKMKEVTLAQIKRILEGEKNSISLEELNLELALLESKINELIQ
jgi:hypothetical protein